ncbi:MAG: GNAT family N-acetyltransferase [bacterium]
MESKHDFSDLLFAMATGSPGHVEVIRSHLEMRDVGALRPARPPLDAPTLTRERLSPNEYRELYSLVGGPYQWHDRLLLGDAELDAYFSSPNVHLWTLRVAGQLAGYFELQRYSDMGVEIMYFGLAPSFIGRGLGGWLLTRAVQESFALSASRVNVHTCTLDSPHALPNYLARGFVIVREERYFHEMKSTTQSP